MQEMGFGYNSFRVWISKWRRPSTLHCMSGEKPLDFLDKRLSSRDPIYTVSDSGWMERANFLEWFKKQFLVAVSHLLETGPVILFMDGHASHINLALIRLAREQGFFLLCLPSHTTLVLQSLDVGAFGPVKTAWAKIYIMEMCCSCR